MQKLRLGHVSFLAVGLFTSFCSAWSSADKKVLLKDVQTLTLRKDRTTTHRRVSAVPQLKCSGGNGCRYHQVEVMRCENAGADYDESNIQWTCKAEVPEYFKLGSTDVMCEGYSNSKDPFILKGSCGVEYRLLLTEKGEAKYGYSHSTSEHKSSATANFFFWALFLGVAGWMLYKLAQSFAGNPQNPRAPRANRGNGWGGGNDDGNDPPPPYTPHTPRTPHAAPKPRSAPKPRPSTTTTNQGWQPGFWSGLAGGAAGGYLAGNLGGRGERAAARQPSPPGWFSSNRPSRNSDAGEGSSSGAARYSSTGFGGTSNR